MDFLGEHPFESVTEFGGSWFKEYPLGK
jgi:hypothetical protein